MNMESQVGYFLNLLHKIFVECNSSGESSSSSQGEVGSGATSQETGADSQSAVESQQAVVQYLRVSAIFSC
jgi:hypothetical protein